MNILNTHSYLPQYFQIFTGLILFFIWEDVTRNGHLVGKNIIIIIIHQHYHYIKTYPCSDNHGPACPGNFNNNFSLLLRLSFSFQS